MSEDGKLRKNESTQVEWRFLKNKTTATCTDVCCCWSEEGNKKVRFENLLSKAEKDRCRGLQ